MNRKKETDFFFFADIARFINNLITNWQRDDNAGDC